ncbi:phage scaffolding protein [Lysinibacillus sphaericus]|uniref:phage scaffolding protein n=1 Tax=Lysinibacillus sphaericus TaxID=1421 RepID=UPI00190FCA8C|nr:phage scaffolding protein [Lysinibacillus sphaericus]QPA56301.1 phage scaffolding protein [Lysinibacillus sphaericus]
MKKEELIAMGLSEEHADAVVGKYGTMIPKERFDEVNKAKKTLEDQVKNHETQLKDLQDKAKGNDELQKTITDLQQANETAKTEYEQQLKAERMSAALKLSLHSKVHDVDLVAGLIDKTTIELSEDGKVTKGLDEQLKSLQESKSFLFVPEKQAPAYRGWVPAGGSEDGKGASDVGSNFAKIANDKGSSDASNNPWG